VLVELMETYILTQPRVLAERKAKLEGLDKSLTANGQGMGNWNRPPDLFRTDGYNVW
jgi:hypothetical protein